MSMCIRILHCSCSVIFIMGVTMNELNEIKMDIHEKYCELIQGQTEIHKTINNILDLIDGMRKEMKSLRTDVDKLIENNNGGKVYGRTA